MQASNRIIVNTVAQYVRTILNMLLSLYSVRLIMGALGVENYGIYSLVAGVVSLLSFFTNSLVSSTQRFLSYAQGRGEEKRLKSVFFNSLLLHILIGLGVVIIFAALMPLLFDGFLNIVPERLSAAKVVYLQVIAMVYISFVASPYRALLVSRENIFYTSAVDVMDGVLKVGLAILLTYITFDKLIAYGWIMFAITLFNLLAFAIYCHAKYPECIFPCLRLFDKQYMKELMLFTGWRVYASASIALRNQGLAIVLNRRLGAVVNAAYGLGSQISGMVSFISASLQNAVSPQLTAAEGANDRKRMWFLANMENKFAFLLLASIGIPTLFEMQTLLEIWLKVVPENAWLFGATFLSMQIIDMMTIGYGAANNAIGRGLGRYTFWTCTPKLLILPFGWLLLHLGLPLWTVCTLMILIEVGCMLIRVPLLLKEEGFCLRIFIMDVFLRSLPPCIVGIVPCVLLFYLTDFSLRFLFTYAFSCSLFILTAYRFSLTAQERNKITSIFCSIKTKLQKH